MDRVVAFGKKYWVIPVSILLWYYPIMPLGLGICSIIILTTGSEYISVFISMIGIGVASSLLIIFKLKIVSQLKKSIKYMLVSVSILIFALLSFYLGIVMM